MPSAIGVYLAIFLGPLSARSGYPLYEGFNPFSKEQAMVWLPDAAAAGVSWVDVHTYTHSLTQLHESLNDCTAKSNKLWQREEGEKG